MARSKAIATTPTKSRTAERFDVALYWDEIQDGWSEEKEPMKAAPRNPKPTVTFNGQTYSLRSRKTAVPDLAGMPRIAALLWLCQNTVPRGYHKAPNSLAGFAGAISVRTK